MSSHGTMPNMVEILTKLSLSPIRQERELSIVHRLQIHWAGFITKRKCMRKLSVYSRRVSLLWQITRLPVIIWGWPTTKMGIKILPEPNCSRHCSWIAISEGPGKPEKFWPYWSEGDQTAATSPYLVDWDITGRQCVWRRYFGV